MISRFSQIALIFSLFIEPSFASKIELMSYNVENLFDTSHDEGHSDYEYLPKGHPAKNEGCSMIENDYFRSKCFKTDWNNNILSQKINAITDVVHRDGRQTPDILGLVEIENLVVARELQNKLGYTKALITDGKDQRGINVALLVRESDKLKYLDHKQLEVSTSDMKKPTRNVLHVKFQVGKGKYLHTFVNHWPSQNNPSRDRENVAKQLVEYIEQIHQDGKKHFIAIMGDFNVVDSDNPNAINEVILSPQTNLFDVETKFRSKANSRFKYMPPSTYYYRRGNTWNHLDRIFLSSNLFDGQGEEVDLESFDIFVHQKYSREHRGDRVPVRFEINQGRTTGVSDHYPVSVKISL